MVLAFDTKALAFGFAGEPWGISIYIHTRCSSCEGIVNRPCTCVLSLLPREMGAKY